MKVGYLIHDLTDPAVTRRVRMLKAVGVELALIGFRRDARTASQVGGVPAVDLGRTLHGRLVQRTGLLLWRMTASGAWRSLEGADVILARNLDMLLLAAAVRRRFAPRARLAYECLDLHPAMGWRGPVGLALRQAEGALMARCALLVTSSPGYLQGYFNHKRPSPPALLVENKLLALEGPVARPRPSRPDGPPWRIGWFGLLRCRRSFDLLKALAADRPGQVEVVIRGRPVEDVFPDFIAEVRQAQGLRFDGPYGPADLETMYSNVHFNWAVDYSGARFNALWALSNRLYEGGVFDTPTLAQSDVESGRWLAARGAGILMDDPEAELGGVIDALTPERYAEHQLAAARIPTADLVCTLEDCRAFVDALAQTCGPVGVPAAP